MRSMSTTATGILSMIEARIERIGYVYAPLSNSYSPSKQTEAWLKFSRSHGIFKQREEIFNCLSTRLKLAQGIWLRPSNSDIL